MYSGSTADMLSALLLLSRQAVTAGELNPSPHLQHLDIAQLPKAKTASCDAALRPLSNSLPVAILAPSIRLDSVCHRCLQRLQHPPIAREVLFFTVRT